MRTIAIAILPLAVCVSCGSSGGNADSDTAIEVETRMVMPNAPMPEQQDTIAVPARPAPASPPAADVPKKRDKVPTPSQQLPAETPPQAAPADSTAH